MQLIEKTYSMIMIGREIVDNISVKATLTCRSVLSYLTPQHSVANSRFRKGRTREKRLPPSLSCFRDHAARRKSRDSVIAIFYSRFACGSCPTKEALHLRSSTCYRGNCSSPYLQISLRKEGFLPMIGYCRQK